MAGCMVMAFTMVFTAMYLITYKSQTLHSPEQYSCVSDFTEVHDALSDSRVCDVQYCTLWLACKKFM